MYGILKTESHRNNYMNQIEAFEVLKKITIE